MSEHSVVESMSDLKKTRAVVKAQMSKADRLLGNLQTLSKEVLLSRIKMLEDYWGRFDTVQQLIETRSEEDDLDKQIDYRTDMEDKYYKLMDPLQERWGQLNLYTAETQVNKENTVQSMADISVQHSRALTSSISFIPFQEDESFKNFIRRLEVFLHLHGQEMQVKDQVYTLLHALTPRLHQKLYDLCAPESPLDKTYTDLVNILTDYVDPQPSTWALQHQFFSRVQDRQETVKGYSVELKKLTSDCDFNCEHCNKSIAGTLLRIQFVRGLRDNDVRTKLLQVKSTKSFQDVVKIASTMELTKDEGNLIKENIINDNDRRIHRMINKEHEKQSFLPYKENRMTPFERLKGKCYRCGSPHHRAGQCKFITEICRKCNKQGHIASVCLGKKPASKVHHAEADTGDVQEEQQEVYKVQTHTSDKFIINIQVEGQPVQMELDTGAAISILPYSTFKRLNINKRIFHTNVELRTYTSEVIKPKGVVFVKCTYKNQSFVGKLYIVNEDLDAIFGRDWIREVQLDWTEIKNINSKTTSSKFDSILEEFREIFEPGIGKIPDRKGHLQLVEGAHPIFIKARPIPYALKDKVEKELDRLEEAGIISKTEKSEWGTPIVPVVKPNGDIRICADFKVTVNKQIKEEHHPIPRIDDIFAQMNGGRLFCTLDLSNAYLHLEMDTESTKIQTLSTHKGQYTVNRLMFGVKVAPGIWQKVMDSVLQGLVGVQCFFDDIIIQGRTEEELLDRLREVFKSLKRNNLRLNRDKCKFFQKKIQYLGHVIDQHGIHKSEDKIKAIKDARRPQNINELRSFLGLVNYYNRFIKSLATLLHPLHQLLKKEKQFKWNIHCEQSFQTVKEIITSDTVLCHFNPDLPLILATDASPVGLGALISHRFPDGNERPIAFASRSLSKAEQHYSQIDKEATGIYWGLKKFFPYCYGRQFTLITDHKPLVAIFNPHKSLPSMSATRLFNYSHFLSGFNYKIEFKRTTEHGNADFLSRFPVEDMKNDVNDQYNVFQTNQINTLTIDHKVLAAETAKDPELSSVVKALEEGQSLELLGYHDNEIALHQGCLFKGWKVIIPNTLRKQVLDELHFGHVGILKTKALARSYCWWKGMDKDIDNMIATCRPCREKQNAPPKEINHPWEPASRPWERIHVDFMGPTMGQQFMIVVDAFSKWVEVIPTKTTTAEWTVKELKKLFSTFGLPNILISDNGRNFTSTTFRDFLYKCGTKHKTTAPFHPSSNGQAERFVQTVKNTLKCMLGEPGTLENKLHRILMQLRQVPNSTGNSAYFLMFNRKVRTHLDLLVPPSKEKTKERPESIMRQFKVGERVQVRNYNSQGKWSFGHVQSRDGNVHYYITLDSGINCRRHVDQMLRSKL